MTWKVLLQATLLLLVISNSFILFIFNSNSNPIFGSKRSLSEINNNYKFDDPLTAYYILDKLDIFEQINATNEELSSTYSKPYLGLIPDKDYCKKHRAYIVSHPETIFNEKNIITGLIQGSLFRNKVLPRIGKDIQPMLSNRMQKGLKYKPTFDLRVDVNNFFTFAGMYGSRAIGIHYSCLSQSSNAIPGNSHLYRKDYISEGIIKYSKNYESRPHCFNFDKFFPETWILYHEETCKDFFRMFNSEEYQKLKQERGGIAYMRKIGANAHRGKGVFPINSKEESFIRSVYKNGDLCGKNQDNNIIQYYVYNPLLLSGHKFDFRIYMLIASTNPVIAYYYDGFLRVSLHEYKPESNNLGALLTNTALSKSAFREAKEGTYNGMTSAELKDSHLWNFKRLEDYLYHNKIVTDPNWLNNYLRPEFKKAMVHLVRMSQDYFMRKSSVYHLFGMDFMLDANLNLWFIEANASPALEGFSDEMKNHVSKLLVDHYEIVYGLMKSRMKRVIIYINDLIQQGEVFQLTSNEIMINNLHNKREEFRKISQNYFEPEFEPSASNGFQPIINENLIGEHKYYGFLQEECF